MERRQEGAARLVDDGVALVDAAVAQTHEPLEGVHECEVADPGRAEGDAPASSAAQVQYGQSPLLWPFLLRAKMMKTASMSNNVLRFPRKL